MVCFCCALQRLWPLCFLFWLLLMVLSGNNSSGPRWWPPERPQLDFFYTPPAFNNLNKRQRERERTLADASRPAPPLTGAPCGLLRLENRLQLHMYKRLLPWIRFCSLGGTTSSSLKMSGTFYFKSIVFRSNVMFWKRLTLLVNNSYISSPSSSTPERSCSFPVRWTGFLCISVIVFQCCTERAHSSF